VITVWLRRLGHRGLFVIIPMVFMLAVTLTSLGMLVVGGQQNALVQGISIALIVLSLVMLALGLRALRHTVASSPMPVDPSKTAGQTT
jgi:carbon starvation protein